MNDDGKHNDDSNDDVDLLEMCIQDVLEDEDSDYELPTTKEGTKEEVKRNP